MLLMAVSINLHKGVVVRTLMISFDIVNSCSSSKAPFFLKVDTVKNRFGGGKRGLRRAL